MQDCLNHISQLARTAGEKLLQYYKQDIAIEYKSDNSPATVADVEAEKIIIAGLKEWDDKIPVIAEEQMSAGEEPTIEPGGQFWLVDPLDGTKEFIRQTDEFTVNIALISNYQPILGVIYAPVFDELTAGIVDDKAIIHPAPQDNLKLITSRYSKPIKPPHEAKILSHVKCGSSLKFCRISEGKANYYPRYGRTMEWDTAAGHAILKSKGGNIMAMEKGKVMQELAYQKPGFRNGGFLAYV